MIYRGVRGRGGRDFRFFEKKLGKKLPCRVVARLHTYNFKNKLSWATTLQGKLLLRSVAKFFSKSDNGPPTNHNLTHCVCSTSQLQGL